MIGRSCDAKPIASFVPVRIIPTEHIQPQNDVIINSLASELRNSVTILRSNIQLLKAFCRRTDDLFIEESFILCECAVNDIMRFIDCIGFLSDTSQGTLKLKKTCFDLKLFLKQVLEEIMQLNHDPSRIQVDLSVYDLIGTDKYLLHRIMINLLVNALKFSRSEVNLIITEHRQKLTIVVRDYGVGIPPNEIKDIFKPFARASNVSLITGTGLGLSIVSRAIHCMNGALYVKSIPEQGTEFHVVIPLDSVGGIKKREYYP
ncbi:MAG: HAMP domain-containing sensor histidine kinase [Prolixibacteraceae bacterium]